MPKVLKPDGVVAPAVYSLTLNHSNGHCLLSPVGSHWWLIEPPGKAVSVGRCRFCGQEKEFYNFAKMSVMGRNGKMGEREMGL